MSVAEIKANIERLKKEYTDPSDSEVLREWESRLSKTLIRQGYLDLTQTQELVAYLKKRLRDIRIKLSIDDSMELPDVKSWHRVAKELRDLLALLILNPEKEMGQLEREIADELEK